MPQVDFDTTMTAHWLQAGIGPREAAAKLRAACGNVEPLSEPTLKELESKWREKRSAFGILLSILGGRWNRLAGFDCEDVESPADHTRKVFYLAAITDGQFIVEDVVQATEPNDDVRLSFTHRGNRHSFTLENHGSWVNLPGTLNGLNRILEQLGVQERFIEIYIGGEGPGLVAFVLPDEFLPVAHELHIQLESTSNGTQL